MLQAKANGDGLELHDIFGPDAEMTTVEQIGSAIRRNFALQWCLDKQPFITNGGIIQPVILNRRKDGTLVCVEGNTRVALYKHFQKTGVKGSWTHIPGAHRLLGGGCR